MKQIPNIFTLLNLLCGCLAIIFTLQNGIVLQYIGENTQLVNMPEKIWMASLFIGLAAVIDFLDGFVARLLNAESFLGAQLDSLADVVSFGVAPSMILYQFLRLAFAKQEDGLNISLVWLLPVFLVAMAGAYRLGRYNVDTQKRTGFQGVPIPAVGLVVASLPLIYWTNTSETIYNLLLNKWFIIGLSLVLSYLMISKLPMLAFKFKSKSLAANLPVIILALVGLLSAIVVGWLAVPIVFVLYIILSLIYKSKEYELQS